ncbi:MAG TPA: RNA methyltransferase [bacterium]|nr:RNA methyltransferase [bacterium]
MPIEMKHPPVLDNVSVVLVRPAGDGNLGQVARAMKNFGLSRLRLVNPCDFDTDLCRQMATNSYDILERAQIFTDLPTALADFSYVVGTSRRLGKNRERFGTSAALPGWLLPKLTGGAQAALLFGNEVSGLDNAELDLCQFLVEIETDPAHKSLNLAQAVLVFAYELFKAAAQAPTEIDKIHPARHDKLERMFKQMRAMYLEIGFLAPENPEHIMRALRRLYGRAQISEREVSILRGILSDMDWYLNHVSEKGERDGYREVVGDGES